MSANRRCPWCGGEVKVRRVGAGAAKLHCCHWESEAFESVPEAFKWLNSMKRSVSPKTSK